MEQPFHYQLTQQGRLIIKIINTERHSFVEILNLNKFRLSKCITKVCPNNYIVASSSAISNRLACVVSNTV